MAGRPALVFLVAGIVLVALGIFLLLFPPKVTISCTIKETVLVRSLPYHVTANLERGQALLLSFPQTMIGETISVNASNAELYLVQKENCTNNIINVKIIKTATFGWLTFVLKNNEYVVVIPKKSGEVTVDVQKAKY